MGNMISILNSSITMNDDSAGLTISQIARHFNLSGRAIRYYQSIGLISPRRNGSARIFHSTDIRRIELILKGKRLGLSLSEIASRLEPSDGDSIGPEDLHFTSAQLQEQIKFLRTRRTAIDSAIADLEAMHRAMQKSDSDFPGTRGQPGTNPEKMLTDNSRTKAR